MTNDTPAGTGNPKKNRSGSNKRQRNYQYVVRCDREEFNDIAAKAQEAGLRGAAFLRAAARNGDAGARAQRSPVVEMEILAQVLPWLGRLNSNVNQIAKNGNSGYPVDLPELRLVMKDYIPLRAAIFKALNKEPSPEARDWEQFEAVSRQALAASPGAETVAIPAALLRRMMGNPAAPATTPSPGA
jgi:hypothetical protein